MGTLTVTEFVTLDGVGQGPGAPDEDRDGGFAHGGWQAPFLDAEAARVVFEQARTMDALLLGRRTYEIFAGYWPTAPDEIPFTGLLNGVPKYVASRTLTDPLAWSGARLLDGPVAEGVAALTERHGDVQVIGSLDLLQTLLRAGVVDRLNLWVHPLVLGTGKRVFGDGTVPTTMRLADSATHANGAVHLTYEAAGRPRLRRHDALREPPGRAVPARGPQRPRSTTRTIRTAEALPPASRAVTRRRYVPAGSPRVRITRITRAPPGTAGTRTVRHRAPTLRCSTSRTREDPGDAQPTRMPAATGRARQRTRGRGPGRRRDAGARQTDAHRLGTRMRRPAAEAVLRDR